MKALEKRREDGVAEWKKQQAKKAKKSTEEKVVTEEEKPPLMDEFIPEPVPIIFPPPPTADDADPEVPAWNDSMWMDAPVDPIVHISASSRHNLAVTKVGPSLPFLLVAQELTNGSIGRLCLRLGIR